MRFAAIVIGAATALLATSLPAMQASSADSAGTRIRSNPGRDQRLPWTFELVWRAGGEADERVQVARLPPAHVALDSLGRVALLVAPEHRILLLSPNGEVERSIARRGGGPGELLIPRAIDMDREGHVWASDAGRRTVIHWTRDGKLGGEMAWQASLSGTLRWTPQGIIHGVSFSRSRTESGLRIMRRDPEGQLVELEEFVVPAPFTSGRYPTCPGYEVEAPPFFTPFLIWDADASTVVTVTGPEYRADMRRTGRPLLSVRRAIAPERLTARSAAENLPEDFVIPHLGCTITRQELVRVRGFASHRPIITAVALGPEGELWVTRRAAGIDEFRVDVFAGDGAYLGTLPAESPRPTAVRGNYLVSIGTDAADVPSIAVYRVTRR